MMVLEWLGILLTSVLLETVLRQTGAPVRLGGADARLPRDGLQLSVSRLPWQAAAGHCLSFELAV